MNVIEVYRKETRIASLGDLRAWGERRGVLLLQTGLRRVCNERL